MQPIVNQDGGQCGMGAKDYPTDVPGDNKSAPTTKGMGSDVGTKAWRASSVPAITTIQPLVDGPND